MMRPESIQKIRGNLNLTQAQFGQLFGIHPMTVSKWERGELIPNAYQVSLMTEFDKAAKNKKVGDALAGVLIGAGIVAALLLLLQSARK